MSEFIYIVSGHTGIYSDRREWVVCWCVTHEDAVAHSKAAAEEVEKIVSAPGWDDLDWYQQEAAFKTKLDPFRPKLYGDTVIYHITKVERSKWPFPEPQAK